MTHLLFQEAYAYFKLTNHQREKLLLYIHWLAATSAGLGTESWSGFSHPFCIYTQSWKNKKKQKKLSKNVKNDYSTSMHGSICHKDARQKVDQFSRIHSVIGVKCIGNILHIDVILVVYLT